MSGLIKEAEKILQHPFSMTDDGSIFVDAELFRALVEQLKFTEEMEWISVEDRLPEGSQAALTVCMGEINNYAFPYTYRDNVQVLMYEDSTKIWWDEHQLDFEMVDDLKIDGVTHWMPLPKPPTDKE